MDFRIFSKPQQQQPTSTIQQPQVLSDEESLEDHSGLEDFQNVTLQLDDNDSSVSQTQTPGTPHSSVGYIGGARISEETQARWQEEREALLSNSIGTTSAAAANAPGNNPTKTMTTPNQDGAVPRISITPNTPPSNGVSPTDEHSTVSLNSSRGSPMYGQGHHHHHHHHHHQHSGSGSSSGGGPINPSNQYWRPQSPSPPSTEYEAKEFFACRDSIIQNAIDEVQSLVDPSLDGSVRGTWLLTEIDHWNNEKERIVLLCSKTIVIIKYDFIAMKQEEHRRVYLCIIDTIIQGELKYPERSITPHLSGIAGGLVGVVKDCIIPSVQGTVQSVGNVVLYRNTKPPPTLPPSTTNAPPMLTNSEADKANKENSEQNPAPPPASSEKSNVENDTTATTTAANGGDLMGSPKTSIMTALSLENFEPRARNVQGIRIMWNQDLPLSFTQKWNPFNKTIPWITFTSHPLLWHRGGGGGINRSFDVDSFSREFIDILSHSGGGGGDSSPCCRVEYKPIVIETYVGLTSLFHNANSLGFYKVRGRISF